jgi:hypothetical protein
MVEPGRNPTLSNTGSTSASLLEPGREPDMSDKFRAGLSKTKEFASSTATKVKEANIGDKMKKGATTVWSGTKTAATVTGHALKPVATKAKEGTVSLWNKLTKKN